jgi:tetratricopeptide (TPR) repeat protein
MRIGQLQTSACAALLWAGFAAAVAAPPAQSAVSDVAAELAAVRESDELRGILTRLLEPEDDLVAAPRDVAELCVAAPHVARIEDLLARTIRTGPDDAKLQLAWIDVALVQGRHALALERLAAAPARFQHAPAFHWRAAQAHFGLGRLLGDARLRVIPGGRVGQFHTGDLLVERRGLAEQFLCAPPASTLNQLRRALDGGVDIAAIHVLHAQTWARLGRPELAMIVVRHRGPGLLATADDATLAALAEVALAAGDMGAYLRYQRTRSETRPAAERDTLLFEACTAAAEHYGTCGEVALYSHWLHRALQHGDDPELLLRLADTDWARGDRTGAMRLYQRWLRQAPRHPERRRVMERLAEATTESE